MNKLFSYCLNFDQLGSLVSRTSNIFERTLPTSLNVFYFLKLTFVHLNYEFIITLSNRIWIDVVARLREKQAQFLELSVLTPAKTLHSASCPCMTKLWLVTISKLSPIYPKLLPKTNIGTKVHPSLNIFCGEFGNSIWYTYIDIAGKNITQILLWKTQILAQKSTISLNSLCE